MERQNWTHSQYEARLNESAEEHLTNKMELMGIHEAQQETTLRHLSEARASRKITPDFWQQQKSKIDHSLYNIRLNESNLIRYKGIIRESIEGAIIFGTSQDPLTDALVNTMIRTIDVSPLGATMTWPANKAQKNNARKHFGLLFGTTTTAKSLRAKFLLVPNLTQVPATDRY